MPVSTQSYCPQCGRVIALGSPGGLCPACLLALGLQRAAPHPPAPNQRKLPRSLLLDGLRRMGWVGLALALTAIGVYVTGYITGSLGQQTWVDPSLAPRAYTVAVAGIIVVGLTLFALPQVRWADPGLALDMGLVLQVLAGLFISMSESSIEYGSEPLRSASSVAVWITVFALAVPASFGKALTAALATASMGPVGLGIQILLGNVNNPPPPLWLVLFASQYMMAVAATFLGKLIYKLGAEVKVAREYGGYQLVSVLGRGGMGEVWKAKHHLVGREAAVKLIRPEVFLTQSGDSLAALRRFEREANATAALHSPHTVSLYNYGLSEDGMLYYVMEILEGFDLETLVRRFGPMPPARVVRILMQVCESLSEAHQGGLIHRDIKPGNILLCRIGTTCDFSKVVDFGLVQVLDPSRSQLTAGSMVGTPAYMSPEVLGGKSADPRTDIYSLGCVAYWLLVGARPFELSNLAQIMQAHLSEVPARPSERVNQPIPVELEDLVMACLEKDPARRPQSAEDLLLRLQGCQIDQEWTRRDAESWWSMVLEQTRTL